MPTILTAFFMLVLAAWVFLKPKVGIYYLLAYAFFLGSAIVGENFQKASAVTFLPRVFGGTYDVTIIALLLRMLLVRPSRYRLPNFFWCIVLLFSIGTFAAIVNNTGGRCYLWQLRKSAIYFLMPVIFINLGFTTDFYKSTFKLIFIFFMIQIPIVLWQAANFLGKEGFGAFGSDYITGAVAGYSAALAQVSAMVMVTVVHLYTQKAIDRKVFILGSLAMIPLILANSRATWLAFPVVLGVSFFSKTRIKRTKEMLLGVLGVAVVLVITLSLADKLFSRLDFGDDFKVKTVFSKDYVTEAMEKDAQQESKGGDEGKLYSISRIHGTFLTQYPFGQVIGAGIGANALSATIELYGLLAIFQGKEGPLSYQLAYTLAEFGWSGVVLILLIFFMVLGYVRGLSRHETDPYWTGIEKGLLGFTILMFLCAVYRFTWYNQEIVTLLYWWMYSAVYARGRERREVQKRETNPLYQLRRPTAGAGEGETPA